MEQNIEKEEVEQNTRTEEEFGSVSLLGNQNTQYPTGYDSSVLETFINKHPELDYWVKFNCPEFTSLCVSGDTIVPYKKTEYATIINESKIKDLVGVEGFVPTIDIKSKQYPSQIFSKFHDVRLTRENAEVIKVNYADGITGKTNSLICTPDHQILTFDKEGEVIWSKAKDLKPTIRLLGNTLTGYKEYEVINLQKVDNQNVYNMEVDSTENFIANDIVVHNCPKTHQPDFASIYISYIPNEKMVESKSLKLYLFSFRTEGSFHEDCVNIILKDLINLMEPKYIEVLGKFLPRGGISIDPYANYGAYGKYKELAEYRFNNHDLVIESVYNR